MPVAFSSPYVRNIFWPSHTTWLNQATNISWRVWIKKLLITYLFSSVCLILSYLQISSDILQLSKIWREAVLIGLFGFKVVWTCFGEYSASTFTVEVISLNGVTAQKTSMDTVTINSVKLSLCLSTISWQHGEGGGIRTSLHLKLDRYGLSVWRIGRFISH
jgi:hypothetical protein